MSMAGSGWGLLGSTGGARQLQQLSAGLSVRDWAVASAILAPIGLAAAALAAHVLLGAHSGYSPLRQTMSVMAADRPVTGIMTAGFVWSGLCLLLTGLGLRGVRRVSRSVLASSGLCAFVVAAFPVSWNSFPGMSAIHIAATSTAAVLLAIWPLTLSSRSAAVPFTFRPYAGVAVTLAMIGLLAWVLYEADQGGLLGLSERVVIFAEMIWPAIVVISGARWLRSRRIDPGPDGSPTPVAADAVGPALEQTRD
ncbi:DUF998 domain-containing protein [Gordonia sputi]